MSVDVLSLDHLPPSSSLSVDILGRLGRVGSPISPISLELSEIEAPEPLWGEATEYSPCEGIFPSRDIPVSMAKWALSVVLRETANTASVMRPLTGGAISEDGFLELRSWGNALAGRQENSVDKRSARTAYNVGLHVGLMVFQRARQTWPSFAAPTDVRAINKRLQCLSMQSNGYEAVLNQAAKRAMPSDNGESTVVRMPVFVELLKRLGRTQGFAEHTHIAVGAAMLGVATIGGGEPFRANA